MIAFFRRAMSSWLVLGLLGLVLIAFIVTGVGDPFGGGGVGGNRLASVGKTAITEQQIRAQLDRAVRSARQQDPSIDTATYVRAGGFDQLLEQAVMGEAVRTWADKTGFAVSRRQVDGAIASIPAFQLAGKFDQSTYEAALAQQRMSDHELREGMTADLLRKQVLMPVGANATLAEGLVKPYAELLLEERKGLIGLVPTALMVDKAPPSDADVQAYYTKNRSRYMVPERRVLRYAVISQDNAPAAAPSEAEIKAYYDSNQSVYGAVEKRKLSQVVLPDEAKAKAFVAAVRKGQSFEKLAAQNGYGANDIAAGTQDQSSFAAAATPAVAKAAFTAAKGAVIDPIKSNYGWHIVRVDDVMTQAGKPLAQVHDDIVAKLRASKQQDALSAKIAKIEDALGDGESMSDVVKANGLEEVKTPAITASGFAPDKTDYAAPPEVMALLKTGFSLAPDDDPVVEEVGNGHYAIVGVADVMETTAEPLAKIKDKVTTDLARERGAAKAKALADTIVARVRKGETLARVMGDVKMPAPQPAGGRRIDLSARGQQVPPPLAMLFTLPKNGIHLLPAGNNQGFFIVKVEEVKQGDIKTMPDLLQTTRNQFGEYASNEYIEQFAAATAAEVGVKRNDKAIQQMKGQLIGGAATDQ